MQVLIDPCLGRDISNYRLISVLGQGAMGTVYLARHSSIGKEVAVKIIKTEYASDTEAVQRFFQEARSANDIQHENIIDIIDLGYTSWGDCYLLMELLSGNSLGDLAKLRKPLSPQRLGHIALQICSGLVAAHRRGIIHRDLKPENIFLTKRGEKQDHVKIIDFGIAKVLDADDVGFRTETGVVLGTPAYMAPEQALGEEASPLSDLYSVGVILYQLATGSLPFYDRDPNKLMMMQVGKPLIPLSKLNAQISPALEAVIMRCLEKDKRRRYPSMTALALALATATELDPVAYLGADLQHELPSASREPATLAISSQAVEQMVQEQFSEQTPEREEHRYWLLVAVLLGLLGSLLLFVFLRT